MYSTTVYLYQQITKVLLVDTGGGETFTYRWDPVYAKTLTVNKGVDNVLLFEFINQEEKPVNITGSSFVFRLLNQTGDQVLAEKPMTTLSAALGRVKVVLGTADTINITAQPGSYSIQRTQGDYVQAAFTDANAGARADCNIVDSVLPSFVPSSELTIPTIYGKAQQVVPGPTNWPDWALYPQPVNTTQLTEFFSSHIPTNGQRQTTVKMDLDHYTGTVKFQAAETYESVWYDVTASYEYLNETSTQYFNVEGFYPLIRACFNNSIGSGAQATANVTPEGIIESINVTNSGQGYIAPPKIQILGNGAGAEAICATIGNGQIGPIIVTNGGSGYTPIQYQGTQRATVLITTGYIQNLQYR
jgi:hypothetical protein